MKITWHGHAFFDVETKDGKRVLIDPFIDGNLTNKSVNDFDPDLVVLTHAHPDHVGSTLDFDAPVVSNFEIVQYLTRQGASEESVGMNTGGFYRTDGLKLYCAPAMHSSGFHTDDGHLGYGGAPNGFILDDGETRFYHTGDTGLFGDMKTVIRDVLKPDVAAIPIGDLFTMGPEHAAIAADWLGVRTAIPMHYDTFDPIKQDPQEFARRVGGKAQVAIPGVDEGLEVRGGRLVEEPAPA